MGFAEAKAACDGRALIVQDNTRAMIKAGRVSQIESLLPAAVGANLQSSYRQQSKAREAYQMLRNWVYASTNAIAKRCAGQPWMAGHYKTKPDNPTKRRRKDFLKALNQPGEIEHDKNHHVLWALDEPNPTQGRFEFIYITVMNLLLTGEWYWIGGAVKDGVEVWAVPSSWIAPDHSNGMFRGYKLQTGYGEGIPIPAENVGRGYLPDPSDVKGCLSPLQSCVKAAKIDDYILGSQEATFERGINPNVVIKVGQSIGPDGKPSGHRPTLTGKQQSQLRRAIQYMWNRNLNNGMPAIIDGMVEDIFKLQNTPQEMDWGQSGEVVKARIMQAFGTNPIIIGEVTPANKAQAVVAETNFCSNVVNPILGNLGSAASKFFTPFYDDGESLAVWLEEAVPKDDEREDRQWNAARQKGDVTQEENRARLKLEPLKDQPPPRSPLLDNPQTMAAVAGLASQVAAGALSHDNAVQILITTLQISKKDADKMIPDDPPEPSPEELAAQAAAQAAQQNPQAGPQKPGQPPDKPSKEFMEELAKSLAGMLTVKWEEEQHPRDEQGRFTDSPGQSMLPGLEDANKPGDNPKASLKDRAAYAIRRSEKLVSQGIEEGATVNVVSSWDDLDDDAKSEAENSWVKDHISEFEEPLVEEWRTNVTDEKSLEVKDDEEFAKNTFLEYARDQGYNESSAVQAFNGFHSGEPDINAEVLAWDNPDDHKGEDPEESFNENAFNSVWIEKCDEEIESRVQDEIDNGPPDMVIEGAYEDAGNAFNSLDDEAKMDVAGVDSEQEVKEPTVYQPISDGRDYEKTRTVVRYLQGKVMEEELKARGIEGADKVDVEDVAQNFWSDWKGSSTSQYGLLLQYATAQELGGLAQKWTPQQIQDYSNAAAMLSKNHGGGDIGPKGAERVQWHIDRGIEIAKAHVHATWAASQYALSKAGMDQVDVYRGLMLDKKTIEALPKETVPPSAEIGAIQFLPGQGAAGYTKLPTLQLQRYGAASSSTNARIANDWNGVGAKPAESVRVVMRIKAPKEAIVSIPAFGQNIHDEEEVVVAGAKDWIAWDAWLDKAPTEDKVPIKQLVSQAKRRKMVIVFNPQSA